MKEATITSLAQQVFQRALETGQTTVTNTCLHSYISDRTKSSRAVLNGTLDGTGPGALIDSDWYTAHWHKEKLDSGRIIHCRNNGTTGLLAQREVNFDFPLKKLACKKVMSHLPSTGSPQLLTLAAAHGNCVLAALRQNPNTQVHNVECDPKVLQLWQMRKAELDIETIDYTCLLQDFVSAPRFGDCHYALINADVMGYAARPMYDYLSVINRLQNTDVLAVTTQCLNNFRNHGAFQDALRKKYAGSVDKQGECMADWMHNYVMIDRFAYKKDTGTRRMEVFIFQLESLTPEAT